MSQVLKPKKGYKSVPWLFGKEIEIPEEWECVNVEYVSNKLLSGGTPSTIIPEYWEGNIPWTKGAVLTTNITIKGERLISELGLKNSSTSIIPKDNLLVVSRVSIGNVSINKIDIAINQDITAVILNKTICLTEFLYWNLLQTLSILVSFSQGTTIQGFTRKDLSSHKVLLPPLPEQQKIATILSNVDNLIDSTSKIIENSKSLKTGLMQKLLTRGIGHTKFKKVPWLFGKAIEIPEEWELQNLEKFSNITMGMSPPSESYNENQEGLPFYQGVTDFGENYPNTTTWCSDPKKIAEKDQILFSVRAPVGETNITKEQSCLGRGVCSINPLENDLMYCYFLISYFKKQFVVYAQGTTYDAINRNEIARTRLPFTSNIKEQQKIASILSNIDSKITFQVQYKEKLEKLKKSLMQKLLTGEVRV